MGQYNLMFEQENLQNLCVYTQNLQRLQIDR